MDDDGEYHFDCTECNHHVETGQWREAMDCPECPTGKLVSEEVRNR